MRSAVASLLVATLVLRPATAQDTGDPLVLDKQIYRVGEAVQMTITDPLRRDIAVRVVDRAKDPVDSSTTATVYSEAESFKRTLEGPTTFTITHVFEDVGHDGRGWYDVVLFRHDGISRIRNYVEIDRETILVLRDDPAPAPAVNWTFSEGQKVVPTDSALESLNATLPPGSPLLAVDPQTGYRLPPPEIEVVRLGRAMPGGAVEPDMRVAGREPFKEDGTALREFFEYSDRTTIPPRQGVTAPATNHDMLEKMRVQPALAEDGSVPDDAWELPDVDTTTWAFNPDGVRTRNRQTKQIPFFGHYEARIISARGEVLAKRRFELVPPAWQDAIEILPADDSPYDEPPTIRITIPDGLDVDYWSQRLDLLTSPLGRHGTVTYTGIQPSGVPEYGSRDGRTFTFVPKSPEYWPAGPYSVTLSWKGVLLEEKTFALNERDDMAQFSQPLEPDIELDDVSVVLASQKATVFGDAVKFTVRDADSDDPLDTGPLIAELYAKRAYSYGCALLEGRYIGAGALVDDQGEGVMLAPGEPGIYEIHVFRPHRHHAQDEDATHNFDDMFRRPGRSPIAASGTQLVGVAPLRVEAPNAPGMIEIENAATLALHQPVKITLRDPGPAFKDHVLEVQYWWSAQKFANGAQRAPALDPRNRTEALFGEHGQVQVIDSFPFDASLGPRHYPGNYEIRVWDASTGLYIAREQFVLRDTAQPALPSTAAYGRNLPDDWPSEDDPLRGVSAWAPPADECVDPVFDDPPEIRIVEFWENDPEDSDDNEYREPDDIWPGHPYFVEVEFDDAPPDDSYRVKVDGERRIRVTRTREDAELYRSEVITFAPEEQVEE